MEYLSTLHQQLFAQYGDSMYYILGFFVLIGVVAHWRLFDRAGQPGWASVVPIYNVIILLRIVGRPASHLVFYFIPVYNIYFAIRVWIETAQSFGKTTMLDYVLVVLLNGLYILNLGMSYDTEYAGPAYSKGARPVDAGMKHRVGMA